MNKEELIAKLDTLATEARSISPGTTAVLYTLCGALVMDEEKDLALAVSDFSQQSIARLSARTN